MSGRFLLHQFRGTTPVVVVGHREVLGRVPVDVNLAVVLVGVQGTGVEPHDISFPSVITGNNAL